MREIIDELNAKVVKYYESKALRLPLPVGYTSKLLTTMYSYLYSLTKNRVIYIEKVNELKKVLNQKYENIYDIFDGEGFKILTFFFNDKDKTVYEIWKRSFDFGYQRGFSRRPYRTKYGIDVHFYNATDLIAGLVNLYALDFDLEEYLKEPLTGKYIYVMNSIRSIASLLAYEIDNGNERICKQIEDIVNDNTGNLNLTILLSLTQSKTEWSHELLGKLLIAARLQEGLRQSIVELIDCGDTDNFKYLLKLILDNNLERFSSVIRAFDVWTGLPISAEKPKTSRYYLEVIYDCIVNEEVDKYLYSTNPVENYIALLSLGFYEVQKAYVVIEQFLSHDNPVKRMVGWYWLSQSNDLSAEMKYFCNHIDERVVDVLAYMIPCIHVTELVSVHKVVFDKMLNMIEETPSKDKQVAFPGIQDLSAKYSHEVLYSGLIEIAISVSDNQEMFDILCDYYSKMNVDSRCYFLKKLVEHVKTKKQRQTILLSACDKSDFVRRIAIDKLKEWKLNIEEYCELENMLRFKTESLRKNIMLLLFNQSPKDCLESLKRLSASSDPNCKLAAEQMVQDMQSESKYVDIIEEAKRIVGNDKKEDINASEENAYGLFDIEKLTQLSVSDKKVKVKLNDAIPDIKLLVNKVKELSSIVEKHKNETYETVGREVVYGQDGWLIPYTYRNDRVYRLEDYPYGDEFREEIKLRFNTEELIKAVFYFAIAGQRSISKKINKLFNVSETQKLNSIPYYNYVVEYMKATLEEEGNRFNFYYDIALTLFKSLSTDDLIKSDRPEINDPRYLFLYDYSGGAYDLPSIHAAISFWLNGMDSMTLSTDEFKDYFNLAYSYTKVMKFQYGGYLSLRSVSRAYNECIINEHDVYYFMTLPKFEHLLSRTTGTREYEVRFRRENKEFMGLVNKVIDKIIETEINRGQVPTKLSFLAGKIGRCYGSEHFAQIVCSMDDRNYVRGYNYAGEHSTKGESLSYILKQLYPEEGEKAENLQRYSEFKKLKTQKIVDAAMYAPQWLGIVEEYLQIPGLQKAGIWFHAHVNDYFDDEKKALVSRYSSISPHDFKDGAFDSTWFKAAVSEVGEKNFAMLYNAAKYIAGGSLHKRSQLFADSVMNKLDINDVLNRVVDKRNKDYLLCYTLIPIKDKADALERYLYIERFKKESRQFGSQRQQSETRACEISIGNLARNCGYEDTNRFVWQMETQKLESVSHWFEPVVINELTLQIVFDEDGIAAMQCIKGDKKLSAIPATSKKNPKVQEGLDVVKSLKEQQKRAKKTLEHAMVNRDVFTTSELDLLMLNPVLSPMLKKILFVSSGVIGFWENGNIIDIEGNKNSSEEAIYIAHPHDLLSASVWANYQKNICSEQIKQPFKQVFREYYCPNLDELKEKTLSRRYAGHQIQPNKAAKLASERGWSTTDGLFKVYYKEHIMVELFKGFVWFSPADIEPPVIEEVCFFDCNTGKEIEISDIPPVLFSECMRDIDLIVSVAHYGAVDPEASMSTVEMRAALIKTLVPLLKLNNVKIEKSHAFINGTFGEYTVHLGSGVAHMQAKGMIPIVPIHSGQRGRVFLPFADDDSKTAEVLIKIVMLAEDKKIKDPKILEFIKI